MKIKIILLIAFLFKVLPFNAQNSLRIYSGVNITNTNYHLIDNINQTDSGGLRINNYILPLLGVDFDIDLNKKIFITTGLGVSWMGSRNFNSNIPDGANVDPNLRLGYLRLPFLINFKLFKRSAILFGYSLNYNFRKNQVFIAIDDSGNIYSIYQPFHHAGIIGFRQDLNNWSLEINYHKGLSRIFDSKDVSPDRQAYLTLGGLQISLGYLIKG